MFVKWETSEAKSFFPSASKWRFQSIKHLEVGKDLRCQCEAADMAVRFQHNDAERNSLIRFSTKPVSVWESTTTYDNSLTLALQKQSPSVSGRGEGPFLW